MQRSQLYKLVFAMLAGLLVYYFVEAEASVRSGLVIFVVIACLWITEALNISVTALLIPVLAVLAGIFSVKTAFTNFANPIIFLFMGGFALAAALQKHALDRAFAVRVLSLSRGRPLLAIVLLFFITALLSMWISNTATVVMMMPMALGLLAGRNYQQEKPLFLFVLLGLAYSGNLGGMATLIGSPPNAIAASAVGLSFSDWLRWGVPMFALLFPLMIVVLYLLIRPVFGGSLALSYTRPPMSWQRLLVIAIFVLTAAGWMFSSPLSAWFGVDKGFDSLVAVIAIVLLIGSGSIEFKEFVDKTNWGILILFGGGLTLSALLQSSGASEWLAHAISVRLPLDNTWLLLLIVCLFVIFLTELVSNTASAALLVPLFISVAADLNMPPVAMAVVIAFCASCAFMLPVATPPNAIVFSSGFIPQKQMMRVGVVLNVTLGLIIASVAWLML